MSANNARYINPNNPLPEDQYHRNVEGLFDPVTKGVVSKRATNVSAVTLANGDTVLVGDEVNSSNASLTDVFVTGTLSAAQPLIGTPVANATLALPLGSGQATWLMEIPGPISAGTTLVFDQADDNAIWLQAVGYDATLVNPPAITSISGPLASGSAFSIRGLASGVQEIRLRMQSQGGADSLAVRMIGSAGPLSIGGGFNTTDSTNLASIKTDTDILANAANGYSTSGTIAANNGVVALAIPVAQGTWEVEISNTFVGTLTFQGSPDGGTTYNNTSGHLQGSPTAGSAQTQVNNTSPTVLVYRGNAAGFTNFQVLMTPYTSGTATLTIRTSPAFYAVVITNEVQMNLNQVNGAAHGVTNPVFANIVNQALGSLLYAWNGGGPNSQLYDRLRQVLGLKYTTATISSGGGIGSSSIVTTANPTGLQCSQWIWLLGGTTEQVLTAPVGSYIPGSATIPITSAILNASHTSIAYLAYDPTGAGPGTTAFLWDSILPFALALNNGGKGILAQGDPDGNMLIAQTLGNAVLSNTNPMPSQFVNQPNYVALTSPPSATNAGSDTALTFAQQVSQVTIQNNCGANVNYNFDAAASPGTFLLPTGQTVVWPKKVTSPHLYTAGAQNLNGSSSGNIIVTGEL